FFFSSRRRHTRSKRDWSSDVCSSDLTSCLSTIVLTSNFAQWLNPAAWAQAANCASFILHPPKMKGRPQSDLETPADWPIPKIPRSEERRVGKEGRYGEGKERGAQEGM